MGYFCYYRKKVQIKTCYMDKNCQCLLNYRCLKIEPCRNSIIRKIACYDILRGGLFYIVKVPARLSNSSLIFFPQVIRKRALMTSDWHNYFLACFIFSFVIISCQYNIYSFTYFVLFILANIFVFLQLRLSVFLLPLIYFSACTLSFGRDRVLFFFPFSLLLQKSKELPVFLHLFVKLT